MADAADVTGKSGLEMVFVRVEVEIEGDGFVCQLEAGEVFDLFEGEVEFVCLLADVVTKAVEVVDCCVKELAAFRV